MLGLPNPAGVTTSIDSSPEALLCRSPARWNVAAPASLLERRTRHKGLIVVGVTMLAVALMLIGLAKWLF